MGLCADSRSDGGPCRACGQLLSDAAVVHRRWRKIRSGEHIGAREEFVYLRCACGERRRLLWAVGMVPARVTVQ